MGALAPAKGHDVLLRALALLPDLAWRLTIAGSARDAEYARSLAALAGTLGIAGAVTFAGEVTDDALAALWRQTDVFALATRFEGFGMAIAEALKRGIVVAITDGGAAASLLTPETGVVAPLDDAPALGRALRRLIFDTSLRAEMRDAAFAAGQHLPDWPHAGARLRGRACRRTCHGLTCHRPSRPRQSRAEGGSCHAAARLHCRRFHRRHRSRLHAGAQRHAHRAADRRARCRDARARSPTRSWSR